jgi:glycosyltransferase involved in cell wall biosynthesis
VVHNGVDLDQYHPVRNRDYLDEQGIDHPYLLFVGRISRQKGILQLLKAMEQLDRVYLVLCAGSPDTPELEREVREEVNRNPRIKWIKQMIPKDKVIQLYSHAAAFVCPSIYEPFGIINLEAMACKAPVIASRVGGIKEVVVDGETGFLVAPDDPNELADRIKFALDNPELMAKFKENGRQRVEQYFSWRTIAKRTVELYRQVSQEPVLAK